MLPGSLRDTAAVTVLSGCRPDPRGRLTPLEEFTMGSLTDLLTALIPALGSAVAGDGLLDVFIGSLQGSVAA